jgi:hypothetical protein
MSADIAVQLEQLNPKDGDLIVCYAPASAFAQVREILSRFHKVWDAEGRTVDMLLLTSDFKVENFPPDTMRRLGWVREEEAKQREEAAREAVVITPLRSIKFVSQSRPEYASLYQALEGVFLEDALAEGVAVARKLDRSIVLGFGHDKIVITPTSDPARLFKQFRYRPVDYVADGKDGFNLVGAAPVALVPVVNPFDRDAKQTPRNDLP